MQIDKAAMFTEVLLLSPIHGFAAASLGAVSTLVTWLVLQAARAVASQVGSAATHLRAIAFSSFSNIQNKLYSLFWGRICPGLVCLGGTAQRGGEIRQTAVFIPGTWSGGNYKWGRWKEYADPMVRAGITVYGLRWHSPNRQDSRSQTASLLRAWLDKQGLPPKSVLMVGHSFGGHVAALVADHYSVGHVATIAAPFVTTRRLTNPELAGVAQALVGRWLLWLVTSLAITSIAIATRFKEWLPGWAAEGIGNRILVSAVLPALILFWYAGSIIKCGMQGNIAPTEFPMDTTVAAFRIRGDEILDEMIDLASNPRAATASSESFLKQRAIRVNLIQALVQAFVYLLLAVRDVAHNDDAPYGRSRSSC